LPSFAFSSQKISTSYDTSTIAFAMTSSKEGDSKDETMYLNFCSLSREEIINLSEGTAEARSKALLPISEAKAQEILRVEPMTLFEEISTILFLMLGVPNGAFSIPILTFLIGKFILGSVSRAFLILGLLLLPLAILPQAFVPERLHSWMAVQVIKYFSFRLISTEPPPPIHHETINGKNDTVTVRSCRPQILVAPPHGVFPYGNLLAMIAWPSHAGHHFLGLAANAAIRVPIFKQILVGMGVIDASRSSARRALETFPNTIGISTGGVAEVFETTTDDECIILKERIGLIKLAIRTGADLVPCYMFGNTKLLCCWAGDGIPYGRPILEKISRKIGFALIILYGRYGLPIPFRVPILAVKGKAISTFHIKCEEPTNEQIAKIQERLINDMQKLFDDHKHLYGWEDQRLIIK
jgi:1-acyl-sn-glycerol-3-phosphate acyltransferase